MGAFNWCAGGDSALYPGPSSAWGKIYGGWDTRDGCQNLPEYPQHKNSKYDYDNLRDLCEYAFDHKVRGADGTNPTITDLSRVECPKELYEITQIKRSDDPTGYSWNHRLPGFPNSQQCGGGGAFCLTRMMDCRKPSGSWPDNIRDDLMMPGYKLVQSCINDGMSRMDLKCGCKHCYC